jgi:hypothetical protein
MAKIKKTAAPKADKTAKGRGVISTIVDKRIERLGGARHRLQK